MQDQPQEQSANSSHPTNTNPMLRGLRRSRGRWRLFAVLAIIGAVLALSARLNAEFFTPEKDYIALVVVEGVIVTDPSRLLVLKDLGEEKRVKGVIIRINSPGGTTAGGEELYEAISRLREQKPVVAVINEVGASAAYMSAIAADRIFARRLSIVGSIGVLFQRVDASGLLETIGINFEKVASGPLKAEPDLDEPMSGEVRASLQALVDDSFNWFVDIVAQRRGLTRTATMALSDGRIINGRVAMNGGLIDAIGGQAEAIEWLESRDVEKDLVVWQAYPRAETFDERFMRLLGEQGSAVLGIKRVLPSEQALDGLVSLWHL